MFKKVINKDIESKEDEPELTEFKNSGDHAAFNKRLRGLIFTAKLMREKGFQKIMVLGCTDEDYNKCNESCKVLAKEDKKENSSRNQAAPSNHSNIVGILDDIVAFEQDGDYDKALHVELYKDMAIWWDIREQRIESKDDAEERVRIWRMVENAIP